MFDRTFILSIKRNEQRLTETQAHLAKVGINPEVVLGFDGAITGLATRYSYDVDNPGTNFHICSRTISLALTHMLAWKIALHSPGEVFCFFEDDVRFTDDWASHAKPSLDYLNNDWLEKYKENWGILYLGSCCCDNRKMTQIQDRLHMVYYAQCLHAYVVKRHALQVLFDACEKFYAPIDIAVCLHALPVLKTFALLPRVAEQNNTYIPA